MPYNPAIELLDHEPAPREAWRAEGLRWISALWGDLGDASGQTPEASELALEPSPPYKPVDDFICDARFRVQHGMFLN